MQPVDGQTCFEHVGVDSHPGLAFLDAGQNEGFLILRLQYFHMPNAPLLLACMVNTRIRLASASMAASDC